MIQQYYVRGITRHGAGCRAAPGRPRRGRDQRLDGLLLTGGADIDARLFGQRPHPASDRPHRLRDSGEMLLLRAALNLDLPLLGICRGLQLLALAYGGTLHQHLPDLVGHEGHSPASGELAEHDVTFNTGSTAHRIYGARARVNSLHHQAIAETGAGLIATGHADDGVIEAAEDPAKRFVLGVQWHPEISGATELFGSFVAACAVPSLRK